MFMALVLPGAVAKLCNPTLGWTVGRPRIHKSINNDDAYNRVGMALHSLQQ